SAGSRSRSTRKVTGASYGRSYPPPGGAAELPPPNPEAPHPEADALPMLAALPAWEAPSAPDAPPVPDAWALPPDYPGVPPHGPPASLPPALPSVPEALTSLSAAPFTAPVTGPVLGMSGPVEPRTVAAVTGIEAQWLDTFRQMQQRTAEAQGAYLSTMAEVQAAFLRAAEGSYAGLTAVLNGQPVTSRSRSVEPGVAGGPLPPLPIRSQPDVDVETMVPTPVRSPSAPNEPNQPPLVGLSAWNEPNGSLLTELPAAGDGGPVDVLPPVTAGAPMGDLVGDPVGGPDVGALLLEVVAEQTGYPVDMLGAGMDLESDLGIDSIKRVQIMAALRARAPQLPQVSIADLGRLRTLGAITDRFGAERSTPETVPAAAGLRGT